MVKIKVDAPYLTNPEDAFRSAIADAGLTPPDSIVADGKLRRFATNGKPRDKDGWYVFFDDGWPAGAFGCWRSLEPQKWHAIPSGGRSLTLAEREAIAKRHAEARALREAEEAKRHAEAAKRAEATLKAAKPAPADHPYLARKGIKPHGAKIDDDGRLLIPMVQKDGAVVGLQTITADGAKLYLAGMAKKGAFFHLGDFTGAARVAIVEGLATGASVHEATGLPVVVAFDAGSLLPVAQAIRSAMPNVELIFCADDDWKTDNNPGISKATEAARAVNGLVAVPDFSGANRGDKDTDFNDMARIMGHDAIRQCIDAIRSTGPATATTPTLPRRLGDVLGASIERAVRRASGLERPISLPWPVLASHFGGGLWPGLHILNAGTGAGKTQLALQVALHAAKLGTPVLYLGLELGELDLAFRLMGEEASIQWSALWTGDAGPVYLQRAKEAVPALQDLPFHFEVARPHGFPPSAILSTAQAMREGYPEADGPGSRPILIVVDFLQLVGDEPEKQEDIRVRIGRASYVLRDIANRLGMALFCISSIARDRYKMLNDLAATAELTWEVDTTGAPIKRTIMNTDAIVGAGKETGDIEYSADSVSVLARVPGTWDGKGADVVFATPKGRATGATWSPLRFSGFRFAECEDGGLGITEAWTAASEKRERTKAAKADAKEQAKLDKIKADANAVRTYVEANPGCSVRAARLATVSDRAPRWVAAVACLGSELVQTPTKTASGSIVALTIKRKGVDGVDGVDGPHPPDLSTPLDGNTPPTGGRVDAPGGGCGRSKGGMGGNVHTYPPPLYESSDDGEGYEPLPVGFGQDGAS